MAYENDIYTRNEDSELAVRVVTATEGTNNSSYDDVFTRDTNGKLAVRVVGAGGGDSHNLGYFATPQALSEAYPTGEEGDYAIVGSTDTVWIWDSGTSAWVDTDTKGQVESVNGQTGAVTLGINDVAPTQTGKSGYVLGTDGFVAGWVKPEIVQVSAMPVASDEEVDNIYQYVGITDANYTNGYFYKCVSDGQTPATYSWVRVDVQPQGDSLPSQTGNAGKFLTTNGTTASWSGDISLGRNNNTLVGNGINNGGQWNTIIGQGAESPYAGSYNGVAVGYQAKLNGFNNASVAIGNQATVGAAGNTTNYGIAIGNNAKVSANYAIQLGYNQTNSDANTFKVANANGNFELMSANGTIPSDRLPNAINKYSTMPTAASTNEGWIVQFTGTTDSTYTHGYIYECKAQGTDPETYVWEAVEVQAGGGGGGQNIQVSTLPTASATEENNIYQFIGASGSYDGKYLYNGYFYKCVSDGAATPTYSWNEIPVMTVSYLRINTAVNYVLVGNTLTYAGKNGTVAIGNGAGYNLNSASASNYYGVMIGCSAIGGPYSTTVGYDAKDYGNGIAIGYQAKNTYSPASYSINIGSGTINSQYVVAIGAVSNNATTGSVAVGRQTKAGNYAIAVGYNAEATGGGSIAIRGKATAQRAIQIGIGTNSESDTFCVGLYNNSVSQNYKMLDSDGTIPEARLADTTNATTGDVLTLDSNGNAVWQAGGSGGGSVPTLTWYSVSTAGNTLTIADTSSARLVKVYKNGLLLQPTDDYTISGTTLTTVAALVVGDKITTEVF